MKTTPPPSMKQRMRLGLQAAAAHTNLCSPGRTGPAASILMYHSVADGPVRRFVDPAWRMAPTVFDQQCAWLARHRRVVSLSSLVETLARGGQPEPGSVVITFDDGYLDNLQVAAPILARHGLPATLFLATDYVDRGAPQWIDRLYASFRVRRRNKLTIRGDEFDLRKRGDALAAYQRLSAALIERSMGEREALHEEIESRIGARVRVPRLTLDWDDVRTLVREHRNWEIGAHGAGHLDLSQQGEGVVHEDLTRCMAAIESHVGYAPRHFSFPYGRSSDAARRIAIEIGLQSAVAASEDRLIRRGSDRFGMGRIDAGQSHSQIVFLTAGGWQGLPLRRGERAA